MLMDVRIEVPKSRDTRSKCSMHAEKAGDDSMQQSVTPLVFTDVGYGVMHVMIGDASLPV